MEALEKTKNRLEADEKSLTDNRSVLASKEAEVESVKQQLAELQEAHATEVDEVRNLRVLSLQGSKYAEMHAAEITKIEGECLLLKGTLEKETNTVMHLRKVSC